MSDPDRPAYYAASPGRWRDWWTLLHPPYTAWHLSYVVVGASLAPRLDGKRLAATLVAFLLAVGISAHALDELNGRPLRTSISDRTLWASAGLSLAGAVALGIAGVAEVGWFLVPLIITGAFLVVAYNLELLGGRVHSDTGFALAWGAFPVITGYAAQTGGLGLPAVAVAVAAFGLSSAQRSLSTPARHLRRRVGRVEGVLVLHDRSVEPLDRPTLLTPLEGALRSLSWAMVALAAGLVAARLAG